MCTIRSSLRLEERPVLEYVLVGTASEDATAESGAPRDVTHVGFERLPNGRYRLTFMPRGTFSCSDMYASR